MNITELKKDCELAIAHAQILEENLKALKGCLSVILERSKKMESIHNEITAVTLDRIVKDAFNNES